MEVETTTNTESAETNSKTPAAELLESTVTTTIASNDESVDVDATEASFLPISFQTDDQKSKITVQEMISDDPMKLEDASVVYDEIVADSDDIMPCASSGNVVIEEDILEEEMMEVEESGQIDLLELQDGGGVGAVVEEDEEEEDEEVVQEMVVEEVQEVLQDLQTDERNGDDVEEEIVKEKEFFDQDDSLEEEIEAVSKTDNDSSLEAELDEELNELMGETSKTIDSIEVQTEPISEPVKEKPAKPSTSAKGDQLKKKKIVYPTTDEEEDFIGFETVVTKFDYFFASDDEVSLSPKNKKIKEEHFSDEDNAPPIPQESLPEVKKEVPEEIPQKVASPAPAPVAVATPPMPQAASGIFIDQLWRRPFEFGWKRELVYRAQPELSKDKGDIYYYTPCGKKLRTRNEIFINLHDNLTLANFTFIREPIGPGLGLSQDEETIRSAKLQVPAARRSIIDAPATPEPNIMVGKRIPKPKMPKGASPPPVLSNSSSIQQNSSGKSMGLQRSLGTRRLESSLDAENKITPLKGSGKSTRGNREPCTIQCVLAMGMIPLLQCRKCLCLYHHECAGIDRFDDAASAAYICQNCLIVTTTVPTPVAQPSISKPLVEHNPTPASASPAVTKGSTMPAKSASSKDSGGGGSGVGGNVIGGMTTWVAPSSNIATNRSQLSPTSPQFVPQMIAIVAGRKYVVVPKTNMLSVSPSDNGVHGAVDGNEAHQQKQSSNSSSNSSALVTHPTPTTGDTDEMFQRDMSHVMATRRSIATLSTSRRGTIESNFMCNFLSNVSLGYDILLMTFQYLKVQELLRAACVSRLWHTAANHSSLWTTVRMKNSQVNDWEGMVETLKRNNTKHLDLRKMLVNRDENAAWENFSEHIGKIDLESIELCRCPSSVVEGLFITNKKIKIINAINIKDELLNIKGLSKLTDLTELRLKGAGKLNVDGNLNELKTLRNLKHLSLTSIERLSQQGFEVIGRFYQLESLELGQCHDLPIMFPKYVLPNLVHLERLRLEAGQGSCCTFEILTQIAAVNKKLAQLELVNFDVKAGFDEVLGKCKSLRRLLLIPTYISQSATTNHMVLSGVQNLAGCLEHFCWVVTLELLRVTELYMDQCDTKKPFRKPVGESIPVMKPVPGMILTPEEKLAQTSSDVQQVEILPLNKVEKILQSHMPETTFKIVKVPFHATWRQMMLD